MLARSRPALTLRSATLAAVIALAGGMAAALPDAGAAPAPTSIAPQVSPPAAQRPTAHHRRGRHFSITVLSGRADLISGERALVAIQLPSKSAAHHLTVRLGHHKITSRFAYRADGRFEGLVTVPRGRSRLQATLKNGLGTRITLVDHRKGGPIISGPQLKPWVCEAGAVDAQCNRPTTYAYEYMSTDPTKSGFQAYDPKNPPTDVATTTTDNGHTVPFIVRVETGYMDRDQYQVTALFSPGKPWTAVAPQPQFDHKLLITHGSSCGDDRTTGTAPATTGDKAGDDALGLGYAVMSTALDNSGHNCNLAVQAESLIMAKSHVVTTYGTLRYTIGTGCSGGSLAEQWIANAYPGIYQGILPTCSFPDAYSTATQFLDYHLLLAYFLNPTGWGLGDAWTPTQMGDVLGGPDGLANAEVSEQAQFHVAVPTDTCSGVTDAQRYNATSNPGGVRCTIQDAAINMFGPDPKSLWNASEKKAGHGFVRLPVDNVGVQYGLAALKAGTITAGDFVDLNAKVGGVDIDTNATPARVDATGSPTLARAYRTGLIDEANNLDQTAIIDCRGSNPGLFHDAYRAFAIRARLNRAHGNHANQVIWEGPEPLYGDADCELNSFVTMDHWMTSVEKDHRALSVAKKIVADKPTGLTDRCYDGAGQMLTASLCPQAVVNVEGTPRTVSGDAISTDTNKCQLKPLARADYTGVTFTDAQWAQLQKTYPHGVCDFAKPGVGQQKTIPWLTYQNARGHVIYGGRPLGRAPRSTRFAVHTHRPSHR